MDNKKDKKNSTARRGQDGKKEDSKKNDENGKQEFGGWQKEEGESSLFHIEGSLVEE